MRAWVVYDEATGDLVRGGMSPRPELNNVHVKPGQTFRLVDDDEERPDRGVKVVNGKLKRVRRRRRPRKGRR